MKKILIILLLFFVENCFAVNSAKIELLKDINPAGSASISVKLVSQNRVYFMADDGVHGSELWRTDGSSAGTMLLKDINTGGGSSFLVDFIWDDQEQNFYFIALGNIWKSDGTTENTTKIYSALNSFENARNLFTHDGMLLFQKGEELVSMDVDTEVVTTISDFMDGDDGTGGFSSIHYKGATYFNIKGFRKTGGTVESTELVFPSSHTVSTRPLKSRNFFVYDDSLYFIADDLTNGEANLWKSDGTYEGTTLLKDLNPGSPSPLALNSEDPNFFIYENKLYFRSYHRSFGYEIWSTDGTESNTVLLKDIHQGSFASQGPNDGVFKDFSPLVLNDHFYFIGQPGRKLWRSDGTSVGTNIFSDLGVSSLKLVGNEIYFSGSVRSLTTGRFSTPQPWVTEGDPESTRQINEETDTPSNPTQFQKVNGNLIFVANDVENAREWRVVRNKVAVDETCFPIVPQDKVALICL